MVQPTIGPEPLRVVRGDTWTWRFVFADADGAGVPFDSVSQAAIRWGASDDGAVASGEIDLTASGRLTTQAALGIIDVAVAPADTGATPDYITARKQLRAQDRPRLFIRLDTGGILSTYFIYGVEVIEP